MGMTILCATDFSKQAGVAEATAATLATRLGQSLCLLHVTEPGAPAGDAALKDHAAKLHVPNGVTTEKRQGRPSEVIRAVAAERRATLLVVGSVGHRLDPLIRLGGTSEPLTHHPDLPTLVIREGESFAEWAQGHALRVLVGVDEDEASAAAVRWVSTLREIAPVDVVLGRVYYADEAHQHYGIWGRRFTYTDPDPLVERFIERDLKRLVPQLPGRGELFYRAKLGVGRVGDHLLELAEAERCQLVVIGSHRHTRVARMWSVAAATAHLARMNVLLVPPDGHDAGAFKPAPAFRRVLVATDFSTTGNAAVRWACSLVEPGGELILAHVTPTEGLAGQLADLYAPELPVPHASPKVEAELAARLRALLPDVSARHVTTRTEVLRSSEPAQAIVSLSEQLGVDTIVLSSHGRSGLARLVRGSVTEAVLRASTRPVLVVR
jgi:nucleotide-binding universal stress UspA family protein